MPPSEPRPRGLSLELWPDADRAAWATALTQGIDLLDEQGPAAHWSAGSRRSVRYAYGQWLGWLAVRRPDLLDLPLAERVSPALVADYIAELRSRLSPPGLWNSIKHLHDAVRVMALGADWDWLKGCATRLGRRLAPAHKAHRMVTADRLYALGLQLMDAAWQSIDGAASPDLQDLRAYRDGLVIALLIRRPVRRRNLAMMRLDHHLLRTGSGYRMRFTADETKNRQPIDWPLPAELRPWIDRYLERVRPHFPGAEAHDGVWPSLKAAPLQGEGLNHLVRQRTEAAFGLPINLHLFRDIAATLIAVEAPALVRASRDLLGHSDLRTTERHYLQANSLAAARRYGAIIDRIRSSTARPIG